MGCYSGRSCQPDNEPNNVAPSPFVFANETTMGPPSQEHYEESNASTGTFKVILEKAADGERLGMCLDVSRSKKHLMVQSIDPGGLTWQWNEDNAKRDGNQVGVGDFVVAVNGASGSVKSMVEQMACKVVILTIKFAARQECHPVLLGALPPIHEDFEADSSQFAPQTPLHRARPAWGKGAHEDVGYDPNSCASLATARRVRLGCEKGVRAEPFEVGQPVLVEKPPIAFRDLPNVALDEQIVDFAVETGEVDAVTQVSAHSCVCLSEGRKCVTRGKRR